MLVPVGNGDASDATFRAGCAASGFRHLPDSKRGTVDTVENTACSLLCDLHKEVCHIGPVCKRPPIAAVPVVLVAPSATAGPNSQGIVPPVPPYIKPGRTTAERTRPVAALKT